MMKLSPMVLVLGMCGLLQSGCESSSEDPGGEDAGIVNVSTNDPYAGAFVAGNKAVDHGREIFGYVNGMDIRCLANDGSKIPCVNGYYFISTAMLNEVGALTVSGDTLTAKSFTSNRSGKKYRWMGWTIGRSATPLVTTNPLTLSTFSGTLRSYWATVE